MISYLVLMGLDDLFPGIICKGPLDPNDGGRIKTKGRLIHGKRGSSDCRVISKGIDSLNRICSSDIIFAVGYSSFAKNLST